MPENAYVALSRASSAAGWRPQLNQWPQRGGAFVVTQALRGVVRNLPAAFAHGALDPPIAVAVVNPQDGFDDDGIGRVPVLAPPPWRKVAGSILARYQDVVSELQRDAATRMDALLGRSVLVRRRLAAAPGPTPAATPFG